MLVHRRSPRSGCNFTSVGSAAIDELNRVSENVKTDEVSTSEKIVFASSFCATGLVIQLMKLICVQSCRFSVL